MRRHLAAVVFCCAVVAVVAAVPQAASVTETAALALIIPATNTFSDDTSIVLADAEGRVVLDLTTATGGVTYITHDLTFAWSPDGNQIAFVREENTGPNRIGRVLYVADVDGGHLRRLGEGDEPSWSPDGRRIAFADDDAIVTAASDGTGSRTIVATEPHLGSSLGLEWSPDGRSLLYWCQRTTNATPLGVCLADPDGKRLPRTVWQSATARILGASFSPDSRSIAVMADSGMDVIDTTTDQVRWHIPLNSRYYNTPAWSPDGSQIAFTGYVVGHCCVGRGRAEWIDVYVINADGSGLRRLTGVRDRPLLSGVLPGYGEGDLEPSSVSPVWWPDGSRLFFTREQQPTIAGGLFMMNADGTCETRFALLDTPALPPYAFPPFGPSWRPGVRPSPPPLTCVDLGLAPEIGEDTPSSLQYPHVLLHDVVTYAITVRNDGTQPATRLSFEIRASGAERVLVAPGACTRPPIIRCRLRDDLPARGGMPINVRVEAAFASGAQGNASVQVTGNEASSDPDPSNNTVDFTIWVRPKKIAGKLPLARIDGTEADDTLFGRPGGDVILGRGGNDLVYAGDGNDFIYGGDGRDIIHCGRGNDTVYANRGDIIARDCEHIRRVP